MEQFKNVYFVGAGGIGMAALERYFLSLGLKVAGYDRTPSPLTRQLEAEGVEITYADDPSTIPAAMLDTTTTLAVWTPAVPAGNRIRRHFEDGGYRWLKRAAVLGMISNGSKALCFAGTHGKTTTSSMCAHVLDTAAVGCNAFLGGILRNNGSNLLLSATSPWTVVEADEYDRSFHHLRPWTAVVTSTDPDHLDIYGTEEAYLESFAHFTELVQPGGNLVLHTGLKLKPRPVPGVKVWTYGRNDGDFHASRIRVGDGTITFDAVCPGGRTISDISLGVPVDINIDNAMAAIAACVLTGDVTDGDVRRAMATFMGPERRFQFHLKEPGPKGRALIDDYAHHPDELQASIKSVRALYPGRHLTVAFQPHLYSRTRDFAPQFARALSLADTVVMLDIYPAREQPIPGVTSAMILDSVTAPEKLQVSKENFAETIKNRNFDILLVAGAGDINLYIDKILE